MVWVLGLTRCSAGAEKETITVAKRLLILAGMLAAVLAVAVTALAQPEGQQAVTGVIERPEPDPGGVPSPAYAITDERTGETHELLSINGSVDLEPYVGERVLVHGRRSPGTLPRRFLAEALDVSKIYSLGEDGETVDVTFEIEIDGEVPEGYFFHLEIDPRDSSSRDAFFCGFDREAGAYHVPRHFEWCEDGRTYRGVSELPADQPISFEYIKIYSDAASGERGYETLYSDTRTFAEDETISVTYTVPEDEEDASDGGSRGKGPDVLDAPRCEDSYETVEEYREEQPSDTYSRIEWEKAESMVRGCIHEGLLPPDSGPSMPTPHVKTEKNVGKKGKLPDSGGILAGVVPLLLGLGTSVLLVGGGIAVRRYVRF